MPSLGYVPWVRSASRKSPPDQLPASLATVYLPAGVSGREIGGCLCGGQRLSSASGKSSASQLPPHVEWVEQELPGDPQRLSAHGSIVDEFEYESGTHARGRCRGVLGSDFVVVQPREDDGDLHQATVVDLTPANPLGAGRNWRWPARQPGDGNGDFDFYLLPELRQGQVLTVDINTPAASQLDSWLYIWDPRQEGGRQ